MSAFTSDQLLQVVQTRKEFKKLKDEITTYDTNNTVFYLSVFHVQSLVFTQ